jgi:hypothetical protein
MLPIAWFEHLNHGARGCVGPGLLEHRFVQRRVEGSSLGVNRGDAETTEDVEHL